MLKPPFQQLPDDEPAAFQQALIRWFEENGRSYPWRETRDPYAILVSEMMLQQTQIATVLERGYYTRWLARFPDLESLAKAPENEMLAAWEGLGYYNRARNLQKLARALLTEHGGEFPREAVALRRLPGIGPYTAGAVASFAFGQSAAIVDGNVARVFTRLFDQVEPIDKPAGQKWLWRQAENLVPSEKAREYNSGLMELGQRLCRKGTPNCVECPVARFCLSPTPESLPVKAGKTKLTDLTEHAIFARQDDKILLHLEQGSRRRGFWKLPLIGESEAATLRLIHQAKYGITRYRVSLRIYRAESPTLRENDEWHETGELEELPIAAPFRKAIRYLLDQSKDATHAE